MKSARRVADYATGNFQGFRKRSGKKSARPLLALRWRPSYLRSPPTFEVNPMPPPRPKKRQKTNHQVTLQLADPKIDEEARILDKLRNRLTSATLHRPVIEAARPAPTLYVRYRGKGFPLRAKNNRKLPPWRQLSPWMKIQIGTMVLAEHHYMNFTIHLHDDRRMALMAKGECLKTYLRDGITRGLRSAFGDDRPRFLFVMEDMDADGQTTRPHAHGSIAVPRIDISHAPRRRTALSRMADGGRLKEAELIAGRMLLRDILKSASGNGKRSIKIASTGAFQGRNIWTKKPRFMVQTQHWVNYAFKNQPRYSPLLGDKRVALSTTLGRQAHDLWEVIRNGDKAVEKIAARYAKGQP